MIGDMSEIVSDSSIAVGILQLGLFPSQAP